MGHTALARLIESQIWHLLTCSVGGGLSVGTMASAGPDARHLSLSLYTEGTLCPSSCHLGAGAQRERVCVGESMCGFPKRNCLGLQQLPLLTQSALVFTARSCGDLPSWHWNPGLGGLVWVRDSSFPSCPFRIFIHVGVGPAHSSSAPLLPVWMDVVSSIL